MDNPATPVSYWNPIRRVFLVWAVIVLGGFTLTYWNLAAGPSNINLGWAIVAILGLIYTKKQMPFSDMALRNIFLAWFVVIAFGIALSQVIFTWQSLLPYSSYLGAIWLALMALGHALTGLIDKKKLYILTVSLQLVAAVLIVMLLPSMPVLFALQYLLAGLVGAAAMVLLILYA
jgi:hypothetical protein